MNKKLFFFLVPMPLFLLPRVLFISSLHISTDFQMIVEQEKFIIIIHFLKLLKTRCKVRLLFIKTKKNIWAEKLVFFVSQFLFFVVPFLIKKPKPKQKIKKKHFKKTRQKYPKQKFPSSKTRRKQRMFEFF